MKKDFIYLASASPRRRALLEQIGVAYRAVPAAISETAVPGESSERYVVRLAEAKATAVWQRAGAAEARPVLAADTTVELDGRMLGKPRDADEALAMLAALSGRTHRVLTAVALRDADGVVSVLSASSVRFRATTEAERRAYCATGEPFDKAGGYGVQGCGAVFVEWIQGSFSAVVGLPLAETAALLVRIGEPRWLTSSPVQ
ncbi:MAG TPA: Maf family protein [Gammaproteobacteria bacterium]|nr:Maf family protein [Gammaproteobacteria bacterium]